MADPAAQHVERAWQVLLVEDEPSVLHMLQGLLEHDGLNVTLATTGEEALARLRESTFDLLVTDKNLPGPDGVELARQARERHPDIGIVMMTGYASVESAQAVLGVVDEYFTKPFDLRTFRRALQGVLERRVQPLSPPAVAPERPNVLLVHKDAGQRERLAGLMRSLGLDVHEGELTRLDARPHALVIDTNACTADEARAMWQRSGHDFPVVAISRAATIDGFTRAISLRARAHLVSSESDDQLREAFSRCLVDALRRGAAAP